MDQESAHDPADRNDLTGTIRVLRVSVRDAGSLILRARSKERIDYDSSSSWIHEPRAEYVPSEQPI